MAKRKKTAAELQTVLAELEQRVTDHTQVLSEARDRLENILNAIPDVLFEMDSQGTIYDFRTNDPNVLNVSPNELIGRPISAILPAEIAAVVADALHQATMGGWHSGQSSIRLETVWANQWFEFSIAAKRKAVDRHSRFVMLLRDISVRKQAEGQIRRSEHPTVCKR